MWGCWSGALLDLGVVAAGPFTSEPALGMELCGLCVAQVWEVTGRSVLCLQIESSV